MPPMSLGLETGMALSDLGGANVDPAAAAWFAAVNTAAGGTDATLDAQQKKAVGSLIGALKSAGVWPKMDRIWIPASRSVFQADICLKTLSTWTKVSAPTWTAKWGYSSNGTTSYIRTGFNPSTATNFKQDSAAVIVNFINSGDAAAVSAACGCFNGTTQAVQVLPKGDFSMVNSTANAFATHVTQGKPQTGTVIYSRTGAAVSKKYMGGVNFEGVDTGASSAVPNLEMYACARNNAGSPDSLNTGRLGVLGFSAGLNNAEALAVSRAIDHYLIAMRRSVTTKKVVVCTDLCTDRGDVGTMAQVIGGHRRGDCQIMAVLIDSADPYGASCARALLDINGLDDVPVGAYQGTGVDSTSPYTQNMAAFWGYSATRGTYPDAGTLGRAVLAANPGLNIVSIGFSTSLNAIGSAALLAGVGELHIMAGDIPTPSNNEYNWLEIAAQWEALTNAMPGLRKVWHGFTQFSTPNNVDWGPVVSPASFSGGTGRPPWDQSTAYSAVYGVTGILAYGGQNGLASSSGGTLSWSNTGTGKDDYVVKSGTDANFKSTLEALAAEALL